MSPPLSRLAAISWLSVSLCLVITAGCAPGQRGEGTGTVEDGFDPHDLAGIWIRDTGAYFPTETGGGGDRGLSRDIPAMTAAGEARASENIPGPGRSRAPFIRSVQLPTEANDPVSECNPRGLVRLLLRPEPIEFIHTDQRLLLSFQWEQTLREIWLDGRELPEGENRDNIGLAWYGHSVGGWEGDTLVVNTVGLDDRQWLDRYGFPISPDARIEERYERVGPDTLELHLTLDDPAYYAQPWASDTKTFRRAPPDSYTYFGWKGLFSGVTESICAPIDEVEVYNRGFRDPASTPAPD